jgi:hypothetical protein
MRKLDRADCLAMMEAGELAGSVLGVAERVAVVLTQSWCPQWEWMRSYLEAMPPAGDREIFWVEYDLEDFFEPFLRFKEETLGNDQVPYVRYYRRGELVSQSNFIDSGGFLRRLEG